MAEGNDNNGNGHKLLTTDLPETDGLSDQQRVFVTAHLKTWNATEAARRAGCKYPHVQGSRLLQKIEIRAAVEEELKAHHIGTGHVPSRLAQLANINIADFIDEEGRPDVKKIRAKSYLVRKYKAKLNRSLSDDKVDVTDVEIETYNSLAALRDIAKQFKMFGDKESKILPVVIHVIKEAATSELEKEQAGRLLLRVADGLRNLRN